MTVIKPHKIVRMIEEKSVKLMKQYQNLGIILVQVKTHR